MWYHEHDDGLMLQVKVSPHARQNKIIGVMGDFLKIAIAAAPEKNKGNDALKKFLSKLFQIPSSTILIAKGANQAVKIIFIPITAAQLNKLIQLHNISV